MQYRCGGVREGTPLAGAQRVVTGGVCVDIRVQQNVARAVLLVQWASPGQLRCADD
jgi:hypothetical protein